MHLLFIALFKIICHNQFVYIVFIVGLNLGNFHRSRRILGVDITTNDPQTVTEAILLSETTEDPTNAANNEPKNCTKAAILELPSDGLTRDERKHGWIVVHIVLACYCFLFLAAICDDYFVPSIQSICSGKYSAFFITSWSHG